MEEKGEEAANTERHQRKPRVQMTRPISLVYPHHSKTIHRGWKLAGSVGGAVVGMKGGRGVKEHPL